LSGETTHAFSQGVADSFSRGSFDGKSGKFGKIGEIGKIKKIVENWEN